MLKTTLNPSKLFLRRKNKSHLKRTWWKMFIISTAIGKLIPPSRSLIDGLGKHNLLFCNMQRTDFKTFDTDTETEWMAFSSFVNRPLPLQWFLCLLSLSSTLYCNINRIAISWRFLSWVLTFDAIPTSPQWHNRSIVISFSSINTLLCPADWTDGSKEH